MTLVLPPKREIDRYGQESAHSERALLRGYGVEDVIEPLPHADQRVAPRPCACGGILAPDFASEIAAEVRHHGATSRHLAWRARVDW